MLLKLSYIRFKNKLLKYVLYAVPITAHLIKKSHQKANIRKISLYEIYTSLALSWNTCANPSDDSVKIP